jgi:hypothetical protein
MRLPHQVVMAIKMRMKCLQIIQIAALITQVIIAHEIILAAIENGAEIVTAIGAGIAIEIEIAQAAESAR